MLELRINAAGDMYRVLLAGHTWWGCREQRVPGLTSYECRQLCYRRSMACTADGDGVQRMKEQRTAELVIAQTSANCVSYRLLVEGRIVWSNRVYPRPLDDM